MELSVRVKMESRGKLDNDDEKVKFVEAKKNVRWREKTCGLCDTYKLPKKSSTFPYFTFSTFYGNQTGPQYTL